MYRYIRSCFANSNRQRRVADTLLLNLTKDKSNLMLELGSVRDKKERLKQTQVSDDFDQLVKSEMFHTKAFKQMEKMFDDIKSYSQSRNPDIQPEEKNENIFSFRVLTRLD